MGFVLKLFAVLSVIAGIVLAFFSLRNPFFALPIFFSGLISAVILIWMANVHSFLADAADSQEEAVELLKALVRHSGAPLPEGTEVPCPSCGKPIGVGVKVCRHCLAKLDGEGRIREPVKGTGPGRSQ